MLRNTDHIVGRTGQAAALGGCGCSCWCRWAWAGLRNWHLSPTKLDLFVWHKSIGLLILLLMVVRVAWRSVNVAPSLPAGMAPLERLAAHLSHALLYVLLLVMPVTGWIINSAANIPFRIFWLIPLPAIVQPDKALADATALVHLALFIVLALLLVVHIGAALRHHFVKRNNVLTRMLPGRVGAHDPILSCLPPPCCVCSPPAEAADWKMDAGPSRLEFAATYERTAAPGVFKEFDTRLHFDADKPAEGRLDVTIVVSSADMNSADVNKAIGAAEWFDFAKFPRAEFHATEIRRTAARPLPGARAVEPEGRAASG